MLNCQNCGNEFDLNDSVNPVNQTRTAGVTRSGDGEILKYGNVWCPYCGTEQMAQGKKLNG